MVGTPPAELDISPDLVRALLRQQHPDLAGLDLTRLEPGWDNEMYRLGETLLVRLPRRQAAAQLQVHEQAWLGQLAPRLSLPVPAPIRFGTPSDLYPWPWSILTWIEGEPADLAPPRADQAETMARFLISLHQPAPTNAPQNPVRGIALVERKAGLEERLTRLSQTTDHIDHRIWQAWREALDAPKSETRLWLHGDLHGRNILVKDGQICGIIDWGDMTSGDVATDLACTWLLFEDQAARQSLLSTYGADTGLIARAKGWAILIGASLLETGLMDNPRHAEMGAKTFEHLSADD
jgi:aminoglycoside phosphotransferase (APT) family kinase protein